MLLTLLLLLLWTHRVDASVAVQYVNGPNTGVADPVGSGVATSISGSTLSSANYNPGARYLASSWIDPQNSDVLFLYGGYGRGSDATTGTLGSLWSCSLLLAGQCSWRHVGGKPTGAVATISAVGGPVASNYVFSSTIWPGHGYGRASVSVTAGPRAGNTYVFGGIGAPFTGGTGTQQSNEMWVYRSGAGWALLSGQATPAKALGVRGQESPTVFPPAMYRPCMWGDGNPYLYVACAGQELTFRFNVETRLWAWMSGVDTVVTPLGNAAWSSSSYPGSRTGGLAVTVSGRHFLFGGFRTVNANVCSVWEFRDVGLGEWRIVAGPTDGLTGANNEYGCVPVRGVTGTFSTANRFGGRDSFSVWVVGTRVFMAGGYGNNDAAALGSLSDLYEFDPATAQFAYLSGSSNLNNPGTYGAEGAESVTYEAPARRFVPISFSVGRVRPDGAGDIELFLPTGYGYSLAAPTVLNFFADLYKFRISPGFPPTTTAATTTTVNGGPTNPPDPVACCGGVFAGGSCSSIPPVCTVAGPVSQTAGCSHTITVVSQVTSPPSTASPLFRFSGGTGPITLACELNIVFSFAPTSGTYVIAVAEGGLTMSGGFSRIAVSFNGARRAATVGCVTTSDPATSQTEISVMVDASNCTSGTPLYIFIAAGVGGVVLIVIIIVVVLMLNRRRRRRSSSDQDFGGSAAPLTPYVDMRPHAETIVDDFEVPEQGTLLQFQTLRGRPGTTAGYK